jgi:hypothetical protein
MPDPTFDPMPDPAATYPTITNPAPPDPATPDVITAGPATIDPELAAPASVEPAVAEPPRRKIPRWLFVALGVTTLAVFAAAFTFRQAAQGRHRAEQANLTAQNDVVYQSGVAGGAKDDLSNAKGPGRVEQNQMQAPLVTIQQLDAILATALTQNVTLVQLGASNGSIDQYNQAVAASNALVDQWNALIDKLNSQADTVD